MFAKLLIYKFEAQLLYIINEINKMSKVDGYGPLTKVHGCVNIDTRQIVKTIVYA
jgi:hypothetical protein